MQAHGGVLPTLICCAIRCKATVDGSGAPSNDALPCRGVSIRAYHSTLAALPYWLNERYCGAFSAWQCLLHPDTVTIAPRRLVQSGKMLLGMPAATGTDQGPDLVLSARMVITRAGSGVGSAGFQSGCTKCRPTFLVLTCWVHTLMLLCYTSWNRMVQILMIQRK